MSELVTDLSRVGVDDMHREEMDEVRAKIEAANRMRDLWETKALELSTENVRLTATLDVVQADRDEWHQAWVAMALAQANRDIAAMLADSEAALERARDLAAQAGAFDPRGTPWAVAPDRDAVSRPPASTEDDAEGDPRVVGPTGEERRLESLRRERDDEQ